MNHTKILSDVRKCKEIARKAGLSVSVSPTSVTFLNTADIETQLTDSYMSIPDFISQYDI
jgi:hypothetical protein